MLYLLEIHSQILYGYRKPQIMKSTVLVSLNLLKANKAVFYSHTEDFLKPAEPAYVCPTTTEHFRMALTGKKMQS